MKRYHGPRADKNRRSGLLVGGGLVCNATARVIGAPVAWVFLAIGIAFVIAAVVTLIQGFRTPSGGPDDAVGPKWGPAKESRVSRDLGPPSSAR